MPFTPERLAELRASAEAKKQAAVSAKFQVLLNQNLTEDQYRELMEIQFTYTLTRDEFRALYEE